MRRTFLKQKVEGGGGGNTTIRPRLDIYRVNTLQPDGETKRSTEIMTNTVFKTGNVLILSVSAASHCIINDLGAYRCF